MTAVGPESQTSDESLPDRAPAIFLSSRSRSYIHLLQLQVNQCHFRACGLSYESAIIKKILVHMHLYSEPKQQRAHPVPELEKTVREYGSYDDRWPGYEEFSVDVNSL